MLDIIQFRSKPPVPVNLVGAEVLKALHISRNAEANGNKYERDNARKVTWFFPTPLLRDTEYLLMFHPSRDLEKTQTYCFQHEVFFDALKSM